MSFWDIREVKESRWGKAVQAFRHGALYAVPAAVVGADVLIARMILRADGLDGGLKIAGVTIVALTLLALGMATLLFAGGKTNATTSKNEPDQSADA